MDPSQLVPLLSSAFAGSGPTGMLLMFGIVIASQWAKAKWPESTKWIPSLSFGPKPAPSPGSDPSPTPAPSTGRPLLDAALKILGGVRVEQVLAQELHRSVSEIPPEPAQPVK